jgi:uncharacterized protein YdcH (DUF465 family)
MAESLPARGFASLPSVGENDKKIACAESRINPISQEEEQLQRKRLALTDEAFGIFSEAAKG